MILLDVGVWLAAVWGRHADHPATADWFGRQTGDLVFCRVTQMSLLRLLSNSVIMGDAARAARTDHYPDRTLTAATASQKDPKTPAGYRAAPPTTISSPMRPHPRGDGGLLWNAHRRRLYPQSSLLGLYWE